MASCWPCTSSHRPRRRSQRQGLTAVWSKYWWSALWSLMEQEQISLLRSCRKAISHLCLVEICHQATFIHLSGCSGGQDVPARPPTPSLGHSWSFLWKFIKLFGSSLEATSPWQSNPLFVCLCVCHLHSGLVLSCGTEDLGNWDCSNQAFAVCVNNKLSEFIWAMTIYGNTCENST